MNQGTLSELLSSDRSKTFKTSRTYAESNRKFLNSDAEVENVTLRDKDKLFKISNQRISFLNRSADQRTVSFAFDDRNQLMCRLINKQKLSNFLQDSDLMSRAESSRPWKNLDEALVLWSDLLGVVFPLKRRLIQPPDLPRKTNSRPSYLCKEQENS